ncbi:glycosyltransferase [Pseudanabaena sp. FACHB-2040]|uniref:glycosyltransferase family 2 protein n=1 Tax=Pseudanabaena sp. FACHB-2040 TaxID=2692859 RepID=UPI001682F4B7|nr:glycosyltransferase [Pseudanabaena sp. FACHB-2040]MBD2259184.1 glycosyltransferase family 2 protein [Pseudanabaena sp. FACHB-2040]
MNPTQKMSLQAIDLVGPSQPLVSLIINNYNYAAFLAEAIDSCLNQTYPRIEVIVVDDGSQDGSPQIIESYGAKIIPVLKANGGQASAMNSGFSVSAGEIVIFLDADDYLIPNAVETIVARWQPETAQLHYRLTVVNTEGEAVGFCPSPGVQLATGTVWPILLKRGRYHSNVTSGNAFSRSALDKVLPIPETDFRIAADGYLVGAVPFWGSVAAIEEPLGCYRQHSSNAWSNSQSTEDPQKLVKRLRWALKHDLHRYYWIQHQAKALGHPTQENLGLRDYMHLIDRLASLRLDPEQHPFASDASAGIARKGIGAVWQQDCLSTGRKLALLGWFAIAGFMPSLFATPTIEWFLLPTSRPQFIQKTIRGIKSLRVA